jgi:ribosomal protein L37E
MNKEIRKGKGFALLNDDGKACMMRCFECGRENYMMAVLSGKCAWCGFDANAEDVK